MKVDTKEGDRSNLNKVLYLGICFMTMSTAIVSAQNLLSQLYSQLGFASLGKICLFVIFTMRGICSVINTHIMKRFSIKTGIVVGAFTQIITICGGTFIAFCDKYKVEGSICSSASVVFVNLVCITVGGIGASFLWFSQSTYVNACADAKNKGFYNGIFWSVFQTAQLWGSSLAAFTLGRADAFTFYTILITFGCCAVIMMSFIKLPENLQNNNQRQEPQVPLRVAIKNFRNIFNDRRYYFLFMALFFSGTAIGSYINFLSAAVTEVVNSDDLFVTNQKTGYVFMAVAIGTITSGLLTGRLADRFDKIKVFTWTMITNELAVTFTILACLSQNYTLVLIGGLLFGLGDTSIQTMIATVIGFIFHGDQELFAVYRFLQAFGIVYAALLSILVPRNYPVVYYLMVAVSLATCHYFYKIYHQDFKRKSTALLSDQQRLDIELNNISK